MSGCYKEILFILALMSKRLAELEAGACTGLQCALVIMATPKRSSSSNGVMIHMESVTKAVAR